MCYTIFIILLVATTLLSVLVAVRHVARARLAELHWRFGGEKGFVLVEPSANCFGVESDGPWQVRGNGCLGLNDEELVFLMWLPKKELRIPRNDILVVTSARSHLGKSKGVELLRIRFRNPDGGVDTVAWAVRDLEVWKRAFGV